MTDPTDPKLAHLDGLNLVARLDAARASPPGLPKADAAAPVAAGRRGRSTPAPGSRHVTGEHYEGGHWLGTFAVYLTTAAASGLR